MKTTIAILFALFLSAPVLAGSSAEVTIYDTDVSVCEGMDPACLARVKLLLIFAPDSIPVGLKAITHSYYAGQTRSRP